MTDPRITKIEAARNEIKKLAADLHTLPPAELHAVLSNITDLVACCFRLNYEIENYPYVEGTFTEIKTFSKNLFDQEALYVSLDDVLYMITKTGHIIRSGYKNSNTDLSTVRHVSVFLEESGSYKDSMDTMKEVTGEDTKIGFSEEKYDGWGFSHNGHDYMFHKGGAVRSKTK